MEQLLSKILAGDRRALAKAITLIENRSQERFQLLGALRQLTPKGIIVGITGSPGAGKSSLADGLTREYRKRNLTVGIIAVDPTSPFTGGAILGDRVRMQQHATDPGVFIRSMGTRGSLGGLSQATGEAVQVLAASGKDVILVETVGVGQSELEIMKVADTTVVVVTPGAGDSIQTIKAGIMEIADIYAVNKADLAGANRLTREIRQMLETNFHRTPRCPSVIQTVTTDGQGIVELVEAIQEHQHYLTISGKLSEKQINRQLNLLLDTTHHLFRNWFSTALENEPSVQKVVVKMQIGQVDPYQAALIILQKLCHGFQE
jgi:LAO/AO transport system kinase